MILDGMIGVFLSEFIVRLISKCFHSMKCSVEVPSGTTPFISFTPKRFILRSSQVGPLSTFRMNSNIGFSIRHFPGVLSILSPTRNTYSGPRPPMGCEGW